MYKKLILFYIGSFFLTLPALAQTTNQYRYLVDLTKVENDKLFIELKTPVITSTEITFYLPKIVPGTYSIEDYGRYVSEFKAMDKKGKNLAVEKVGDNAWKIKEANRLTKITYWIDDTFDTKKEGPEIFWPAGTNIEENKDFIINTSGFFGYFEGMKKMPFEFNIVRSKDFYGTTGLIAQQTGKPTQELKFENIKSDNKKRVDVYQAQDYDQLIDSPLMYAQPDTAIIKVANAEVLIGCYSPNKKVNAKEIAASIREVLMAQKDYLGGQLPVNKYAFIFYFTDKPVMSYGALEHSYSSLYYMPELTIDDMNQQLRDFAAHEFFHIVTPLTVHSEEIGDFDFNNPKMSQHLWMYEGVTEYFASNVQVKYGLISPDEYLEVLNEKMMTLDQFDDALAFTELSKYTLDKYHDQYNNVYVKGALIGLCLDLQLRKLSAGRYGLRNLMLDLSKKFGKKKAFKDDELFSEIVKMTYPEIGEFFNKYVKAAEPLPFEQELNWVGVTYKKEERFKDYSLGLGNNNVGATQVEDKPYLYITSEEDMDEMGKKLGFKKGDILVKVNGEDIPELGPGLKDFFQKQKMLLKEGNKFTYGVMRKNEKGENKPVELSADVTKVEIIRKHIIYFDESPTAEQLALRKSWLEP